MSPEQERLLHQIHGLAMGLDAKLDGLTSRLGEHEESDVAAHARIGKVERSLLKLGAYYAAACVIVPIVWWILNALQGRAHAQ